MPGKEDRRNPLQPPLVHIASDRLDEAAGVLARAFEHDPLIPYTYGERLAPDDARLLAFFHLGCLIRTETGWPLYGVERDGSLLGVACITSPGEVEWPASLNEAYRHTNALMGTEATARFEAYAETAEAFRPREPHYYLGVIGIEPTAQGTGLARLMLDVLHAWSAADAGSAGVGLDTTKPENVALYEHFGYEVVGQRRLGELDVWGMYRRDSAS